MKFTVGLFALTLFSYCRAGEGKCKSVASKIHKLHACTTASAFCSSALSKEQYTPTVTKTATVTTTVAHSSVSGTITKSKTKYIYTETLVETAYLATINYQVTTLAGTCGGSGGIGKLKRTLAAATPSGACAIAKEARESGVLQACDCVFAPTVTETATVTSGGPKTATDNSIVRNTETILTDTTTTTDVNTYSTTTQTVCATACPNGFNLIASADNGYNGIYAVVTPDGLVDLDATDPLHAAVFNITNFQELEVLSNEKQDYILAGPNADLNPGAAVYSPASITWAFQTGQCRFDEYGIQCTEGYDIGWYAGPDELYLGTSSQGVKNGEYPVQLIGQCV